MDVVSFGNDGLYGKCITVNGADGAGLSELWSDPVLSATIDMREYSMVARLKINTNALNQLRIFNVYNSSEYSVVEVRTGNKLGFYIREQGIDQTVDDTVLGTIPDDEWFHFIQYNSESAGVAGIYMNGTNIEFSKTTPGLSNHVCGSGSPDMMFEMDGQAQHIAFYDHKLSQDEVNSLLA